MSHRPDHIVRRLELVSRRFERELASLAREMGREFDITPAQSRLLQMIPPQGVTATELSEYARITKQGLGQMVDSLQMIGLVSRTIDPHDARARIITRTASGDRAADEITRLVNGLEARLRGRLGDQDYENLWRLLGDIGEV